MYRLTKIYIFIYIYILTFFLKSKWYPLHMCEVDMCTLSDFWQQWVDASEWWLNVFCSKNIKEVKGQLGNFVLGDAMESKRCCHSNRSSCSFMMCFLPIGLNSQWHRESWWCVMFPKRWNSLESCDGPCTFLSFRKSPGPEQRHAGIHRPQKHHRFAPLLMGCGYTTRVRLYLSVGNDKPHKKKKKKICSYTSNSQTFFVPHK